VARPRLREEDVMPQPRCALVVEDSPTMRQLLTLALRRIPGLSFVEATNGAEALQLIAGRRFDLILLDLNMPVMGGFAFLEHLAGNAERPPVIVITTENATVDRERAQTLGVVAYVTKPVRGPDLAATVLSVLGQ
jgi:two-component system, chemotaxis family, chemotaxis protein CheY